MALIWAKSLYSKVSGNQIHTHARLFKGVQYSVVVLCISSNVFTEFTNFYLFNVLISSDVVLKISVAFSVEAASLKTLRSQNNIMMKKK